MPRPPGGMGRGLALALGVHVLLVLALAFSVSWHTSSPAVAEAELWGAVPQVAAPRATDPEPPPKPVPQPVKAAPPPPVVRPEPEPAKVPDAQIALEKAKKEDARREEAKREEARREKLAEDARDAKEKEKEDLARKKKEKLAEAERKAEEALVEARERNIKKILGDAAATGSAEAKGAAPESKSISPSYAGRLKARVKPNIVYPDAIEGNPIAEVLVTCAPDGKIISRKLSKASGVKSWDEAVLRAIDKTEVFPLDEGRMPSPTLTLVFSPRD